MADSVSTFPIFVGRGNYVYKFTSISDGTGEVDVVKIDVSTLVNTDGEVGTRINIEEVVWTIQGFAYVLMKFDYTTDIPAGVLSMTGAINYQQVGRLVPTAGTGDTGDLLFTTGGAVSGASYDITIAFRVD